MKLNPDGIFEAFIHAIEGEATFHGSIKNGEMKSETSGNLISLLFIFSTAIYNMAKSSLKDNKINTIIKKRVSSMPTNMQDRLVTMIFVDLLLDKVRDFCIVNIEKDETDKLMDNYSPEQLAILMELLKMDKKDLDEIKKKLNL